MKRTSAPASKNFIVPTIDINFAGVRDKKDLLKIIHSPLKDLFHFRDHFVAVINDDGLTLRSFLQDTQPWANEHPLYQQSVTTNYALEDGVLNKVIASIEPLIFALREQQRNGTMPEYFQILYDSGIKRVVMVRLQIGGKVIGLWCICIQESRKIGDSEFELIKKIASHLSLAIANILANEEIERREIERELLLSISTDIATVRSNSELTDILTKRLKQQLGFSHLLIGLIGEDPSFISAYIIDPASRSKKHPDYEKATQTKIPTNDGILNMVSRSPVPVVFDLDEQSNHGEMPLYFRLNYESGLKQAVITAFSKSGRAFGFWMLFFEQKTALDKSELSLIGGLTNQISIAVSNIIANEEIQKRQREKSMLLSFSNALASARNRKELSMLFSEELRKFGIIGNYSLRTVTEDGKHHQMFLFDERDHFTVHPDFQKILTMQCDVNDGITNVVLSSSMPVSFNIEELNQREAVPAYVRWWKEIGLVELTGLPVKQGEKTIGLLWLSIPAEYDKVSNAPLLQNISAQIGIALANILANEKVIAQLNIINCYKQQLEEEKIYLQEEIEATHNYSELIGNSSEMQKTLRLVSQVAPSDSTVLLLGETGTGKELIARAIHNNSHRKDRLMVKVNCAALPANLIESELFGHERGSFTGATDRRVGKFELAHKGTLFLDEIGEMPLDLQVKLLRALQEKEIERVGGTSTIKVDVRIIAATNRDLKKEMEAGRFRSDLYYRLNIFPINLPSLRMRQEDIPLLASYFIQRYTKKTGKRITGLSNSALQQLLSYNWPGNIREMEHLIERTILLSTGSTIRSIELPSQKRVEISSQPNGAFNLKTIDENERDHILAALKYCKGRIAGEGGAAERLGVPKSTLNSKIKRLGIRREHTK